MRKRTESDDVSFEIGVAEKKKISVGCPYQKNDPYLLWPSSCRGKGFKEMGKLKDHLKDVHEVSKEFCKAQLNFKAGKFIKLQTIDRKWKLAFHILFPRVPEHETPSPYANEEVFTVDDLEVLCDGVRNVLLKNHRVELLCEIPDFVKKFDIYFKEAKKSMKTRKENSRSSEVYGYLTPPSTNSSPQLDTLNDQDGHFNENDEVDEGYCEDIPSRESSVQMETTVESDAKPALEGDLRNMPTPPFELIKPELNKTIPHFESAGPVNPNLSVSGLYGDPRYAQPSSRALGDKQASTVSPSSDFKLYPNHPKVTSILPPAPYTSDFQSPYIGPEKYLDFRPTINYTAAMFFRNTRSPSLPSKCMEDQDDEFNDFMDWDSCTTPLHTMSEP
ncbi:hypothetical protein EJ02DRAFT_428206 [Clathrospora elynae]|uniref:Uncharacterized protein n=1 Tax=Clathrospora elynae TaxID=706981 RepID=A0A6A5S4U7_9PLEO|nr:hypothetical protein EJ02DRAFT_428206 [Clathrospora elynae]